MERESAKLVFVGKIVELKAIEKADLIESATVVCGHGGKWQGIVKKGQFDVGSLCVVFLPDSLLPKEDWSKFMEPRGYRVKMMRLRGAPSEVLIMPLDGVIKYCVQVGDDLTLLYNVEKYHKPVPAHLQGKAIGYFPDFIPKTDELNYQRHPDLVDSLVGKPYYMTLKCDGSSTTAYRWKGKFGVCSRNLELEPDPANGYFVIANRYKLEERLPEGIALQWETCGPGIQSNPMRLDQIEGFAFSGYNIAEHRYLTFAELKQLCADIEFPMVLLMWIGESFSKEGIETFGEGYYKYKVPQEGVVIRSLDNYGHAPISFKVINLDYER